jgi:YEATS domain-containing protein 4
MTATADQSSRLPNTTTCLPLTYGSIAFYLGPQSDEYHTHKWTLYLRSPDPNFDLSRAISKVVFQLHPSFSQATRELTEPPFEVTECGWGEFEASVRVVWREVAEERSTIVSDLLNYIIGCSHLVNSSLLITNQLTHGIKLYPSKSATSTDPSTYMNTSVPVVSEKYDEVVFTNPKQEFHNLLLSASSTGNPYPLSNQPSIIEYFRTYGDEEEVQKMLAAKKFLEGEVKNVRDRLRKADLELEEIKTSLALVKDAGGGEAGKLPLEKIGEGSKAKKSKNKASTMEQGLAKKAKVESVKAKS